MSRTPQRETSLRPPTQVERLAPNLVTAEADGGRIAENILQFARLLRAAGLPVGPDKTLLATEAVLTAGLDSPTVLYWTLHAVFVTRPDQHAVFDQAFFLFWKDPQYLENMLSIMLPSLRGGASPDDQALARRLREPLLPAARQSTAPQTEEIELDLSESWSAEEVLREKDFEQMSAAEEAAARAAIRNMTLALEEIPTRRFRPRGRGGRIDLRRTVAEMAARGPDHVSLHYKDRRWRRPPLVVLCDISGSMDGYSRMLLHFLHALTNARDRVHVFLFGTRLTNITRTLRARDPDAAIGKVAGDVKDWSGGTRIGAVIEEFNRRWGRRVLGQNALVLLITDGLDRDDAEGLARAARRLRASCRRLIWLNPLLRFDGYQPIAAGARALRPHVSELRGCHNLASLDDLAAALSGRSVGAEHRVPAREVLR